MSQDAQAQSTTVTATEIVYPDSDGKPMADNTRQYQYIITIQVGLDSLFAPRADVFVAADLFWYPVEGQPGVRQAPDVLVAFGRPKGHRGSYKQWEEGHIVPQVTMEILSPSNRRREMTAKRLFYERYGVQEYYVYDPDRGRLEVWQRAGEVLQQQTHAGTWTSELLGIHLRLESDGELSVFRPDGRKFMRPMDIEAQAEHEHQRAEHEHQRAEHEHQRAEHEHQRAEHEHQRAEEAEATAQRLAARLRALGLDPDVLTQ